MEQNFKWVYLQTKMIHHYKDNNSALFQIKLALEKKLTINSFAFEIKADTMLLWMKLGSPNQEFYLLIF